MAYTQNDHGFHFPRRSELFLPVGEGAVGASATVALREVFAQHGLPGALLAPDNICDNSRMRSLRPENGAKWLALRVLVVHPGKIHPGIDPI